MYLQLINEKRNSAKIIDMNVVKSICYKNFKSYTSSATVKNFEMINKIDILVKNNSNKKHFLNNMRELTPEEHKYFKENTIPASSKIRNTRIFDIDELYNDTGNNKIMFDLYDE